MILVLQFWMVLLPEMLQTHSCTITRVRRPREESTLLAVSLPPFVGDSLLCQHHIKLFTYVISFNPLNNYILQMILKLLPWGENSLFILIFFLIYCFLKEILDFDPRKSEQSGNKIGLELHMGQKSEFLTGKELKTSINLKVRFQIQKCKPEKYESNLYREVSFNRPR